MLLGFGVDLNAYFGFCSVDNSSFFLNIKLGSSGLPLNMNTMMTIHREAVDGS
jgi:hypothetical protein